MSSEKNVIYRTMAGPKFFNVEAPKESRQKERAGGSSLAAQGRKEKEKGQSTVNPSQANQMKRKTYSSGVSGEESLGALFHDGESVDAHLFRQRSL